MQYLNDFNDALAERHQDMFKDAVRVDEEDFYRDSERFTTLNQIANLSFQDIEEFYDKASVGSIDRQAE
jgi:hypothetical protein